MNACRTLGGAFAALAVHGLSTMALAQAALAQVALAQAAPAQGAAAQQAPSAAELATLLRALDARFEAGDVAGYVGSFAADHPGAVAMFGHHLTRLCDAGSPRTRASVALTEPRRMGERWVVRVRHTVAWPKAAAGAPQALVEDSYLAVRRDGDALVPTFAVEMATERNCVAGDTFRCPACNYQIGGVDGWLCVPLRSDRSPTIEAASFYLVGTDVACDVSVQPATPGATALDAASRLSKAFADLEPSAQPGLAAPWLPPSVAAAPPKGLDGARIEVDLPARGDGAQLARARFHVVSFGGLEHVLLLRGSAAGLAAQQPAVDALLQSYRLLEPNCELAEFASGSLRHHTGGALDGTTYTNDRYMVQLRGPAGWKAEILPGGAAFRAVWSSPNGSRLWLIGYPPPVGLDAWTAEHADRWLTQQCAQRGLTAVPDPDAAGDADASGWRTVDGVRQKALQLRAVAQSDLGAPRLRLFRAVIAADLLLVVDGHGATPDDEAAVRAALRTLQRD